MILIRPPVPADLKAVTEIYNAYAKTPMNFREDELTEAEMLEKCNSVQREYIFLVAEDSESGAVVGLAYSARFRLRKAYRVAETTIYLAPGHLARGVGRQLYRELVLQTKRKHPELTGLVALIIADNIPSIRFHEKMHFRKIGVLPKAGFKCGEYHDLELWHYAFEEP